MTKPKGDKKGDNGEETVAGYFRRVFGEDPKLLDSRSNDELLARWLADHPGEKEVPERVRQNLSNVKSVLRKGLRKSGKRKQARDAAAGIAPAAVAPRRSTDALANLEEHIDEAITIARVLDREGLQSVISLLRRARNEVVWKQGQ